MDGKSKKIITIIAIIAVIIVLSVFTLQVLEVFGAGLPFGGFITNVFFCSCNGGWLLTVGPPVGGDYLYMNTPQYAHFQLPRPGVWVLGLYEPAGVCTFHSGDGCAARPAKGIITPYVGTSL